MAADVLDVVPAQLEAVKSDLEVIFEQTDQISSMVKKSSRVQQVSRYLWRLPMKLYQGFNFAKYIGNGGVLPPGTGPKLAALEAAYYYSALSARVTQEQIDTSANPAQSVINVLSDCLANIMVEAGVLDDITFHQSGNGILTSQSSAVTNTPTYATMTFAGTTDYLNVSMLREGMCVSVWNAAGTTERVAATAAPLIITGIDYDSYTVTFNQLITALAQTDIIAFRGMAVYGPATLTTLSAGYPGTPGDVTTAGQSNGIQGDSFRHGAPYMLDTTSSNYFYGKQKSTIPQLNPVRINAQSATFEWDHVHRLIAKFIRRRSKDAWKGLIGIAPMAQRAAIFNLGISISNKLMTSDKFGGSLDLLPNNVGYEETFNIGGIPVYVSKRIPRDRIWFLNPAKLGRAQLFDTKFFDLGGRTTYEGRDPTTGSPMGFVEFFVIQAYDFVSFDGGAGGIIDSLALPSNWTD